MKTPLRLPLLACLLGLLTLPSAAVPIPWKNCGKPGDTITISKADASVWPPQRGKPITISFAGSASKRITAISGTHVVVFSGIPIINQQFKTPFSVEEGPFSHTFTETPPTIIPAGSVITVHWDFVDQDKVHAFCMDLTIPFK